MTLSPNDVVAHAAEVTLNAGSARVSLTFEHTRSDDLGAKPGESDEFSGVADFDRHLTLLDSADATIVAEDAIYVDLSLENADPPWRRYDLEEKPGGEFLVDWYLGRLDPVRLLEFVLSLKGSNSFFETYGEDEVGGVGCQSYRGVIEQRSFVRFLVPEAVYAGLDWSSEPHSHVVELTACVAEEGAVRRVMYTTDVLDQGYLGRHLTVDFSNLGEPVAIDLPLADQMLSG